MSQAYRIFFYGAILCAFACQEPRPNRGSNPLPTMDAETPTMDAETSTMDAQQVFSDSAVDGGGATDASMMAADLGFAMDAMAALDASSPAEAGIADSGVLHGSRPSSPMSVPNFMALNSDGSQRTQADLIGHPTVLWFFPFAGTPG